MGAQIALQNAIKGYPVSLYDVKTEALLKAKEAQENELNKRIEKKTLTESEKESILNRITYSEELSTTVKNSDCARAYARYI